MRIYPQKNGSLSETERLEIARLLVKAGYTVRIGKEKPANKPNGAYVFYIEYSAQGQPREENENGKEKSPTDAG